MSDDDITVLREDIRNLDDKINTNCQRVAIIETKIAGDEALRKDRQAELDRRLGKIETGVATLISRNAGVDGWFENTKKIALWIGAVAVGCTAIFSFLKFVVKVL